MSLGPHWCSFDQKEIYREDEKESVDSLCPRSWSCRLVLARPLHRLVRGTRIHRGRSRSTSPWRPEPPWYQIHSFECLCRRSGTGSCQVRATADLDRSLDGGIHNTTVHGACRGRPRCLGRLDSTNRRIWNGEAHGHMPPRSVLPYHDDWHRNRLAGKDAGL